MRTSHLDTPKANSDKPPALATISKHKMGNIWYQIIVLQFDVY